MQARSPVTMLGESGDARRQAQRPRGDAQMALNVASEQIKRKDYYLAIAGLDGGFPGVRAKEIGKRSTCATGASGEKGLSGRDSGPSGPIEIAPAWSGAI